MGFELGFEKNNVLGNGIRTPLHDPHDAYAYANMSSLDTKHSYKIFTTVRTFSLVDRRV